MEAAASAEGAETMQPSVGAAIGGLHAQLRQAARALHLDASAADGAATHAEGCAAAAGAVNAWHEFDSAAQRRQYDERLAALKHTLEGYQARARAGHSVAIRRVLVASRDAEAAAKRHGELQSTVADCKRLVQRHIAARRDPSPTAATPFGGGSGGGGGAHLLAELEAAAADLGLDTYLDASAAAAATLTLSSEAILVDVAMSKTAEEEIQVDSVTVQLMHAQRGAVPHPCAELVALARRDWAAFRRRLALIVQTAALAAVAVQASSGAGAGASTAAHCLEAVEADIRALVDQERELQAAAKTTATARLLRGSGLIQDSQPVDASAKGGAGAGPVLKALWVYAEPAAFSLAVETSGSGKATKKAAKKAPAEEDDSSCLQLAASSAAGQLRAIRMVLALERTGGGGAGAMQAGSWLKSVTAAKPNASSGAGILDIKLSSSLASATEKSVVDGAPRVTVSAQLLDPVVVAPRTLAALQALGTSVVAGSPSTDGAKPGEKRKRGVDTGGSTHRTLTDMLLPAPSSQNASGRSWDVAWESPSEDGYRLQRFVTSGSRGEEGGSCGLRISRLLCCANVEAWRQTVGLLRQQATWNALYCSCFQPVGAKARDEVVSGAPGAAVFELLSADSTSPELLSLRFVQTSGGDEPKKPAAKTKKKPAGRGRSKAKEEEAEADGFASSGGLKLLSLELRVGIGGTVTPSLAASSSSASAADGLEDVCGHLGELLMKTHQLPVALAMAGLGYVKLGVCVASCCSGLLARCFPNSLISEPAN